VFELLAVDVEERRLDEAPHQRGDAQECADALHEMSTVTSKPLFVQERVF